MNARSSEQVACPDCGAAIPADPGYIRWCDSCEWNVDPKPVAEFPTFFDRINLLFGRLYGARLYGQVMESASSLKPRLNLSRLAAYAIAGLVHLLTLALLVGGIVLPVWGRPTFLAVVAGLLALSLAWVLRPRFAPVPDDVLPRSDYPELYAVADRIAAVMGLKRIDGLATDHDFNAEFRRAGLRGRTYITLGLPLVSILDADELAALIGHEVAHGVNGDVQRYMFVGSAIGTLEHWDYFLRPAGLFSAESGLPGLFMLPVNLLLLGVATLARVGLHGLALLLYRDSQRAEYLADRLGTEVAGIRGMRSLLEKLYYAEAYELALQRTALNKGLNLFEELRREIAAMPEREKERLRRVSRRSESRVDAMHPATLYRVGFIERHGAVGRSSMLSEEERKKMMSELSGRFDSAGRAAIDAYKNRLYS